MDSEIVENADEVFPTTPFRVACPPFSVVTLYSHNFGLLYSLFEIISLMVSLSQAASVQRLEPVIAYTIDIC